MVASPGVLQVSHPLLELLEPHGALQGPPAAISSVCLCLPKTSSTTTVLGREPKSLLLLLVTA